ncbi:MAG: UDP-N-acetylmuramoyl-tripeptide--D-alanyl-D-alanine ligase [Bacteroidota bacterium]|jgi:UDP-N-acetylmuramoyl-tripeptide--D-alanyl-D-alanine ligase
MDIKIIHNLFLKCKSIAIDTRKIESESLFVAIKGENHDANTFAKEALDKGASYVIIDNPDYFIDERTVVVKNSLETLQSLAQFHRKYLSIPIIALTGSNGKTTTKELIHVVLSKKFNTKATVGNLNNHIGVPLTLLSFDSTTEIGIVEMGANHQKEIEFLCEIAQPDFGYITNFGKAHLEGFGGVEGVIKGKCELYNYLSKNNKTVFVNCNDNIQVEKSIGIKSFTFGVNKTKADVLIDSITANPFVEVTFSNCKIISHLIGLYNSNNINAAIAIGTYFKIPNEAIKAAIEDFVPDNNRSQLLNINSNTVILDAYNANPSSMAVAIDNFLQLDNPKKIAVLGDMFELGAESLIEHKNIISLLLNKKATIYFIGNYFYKNKLKQSNMHFFETFDSFKETASQLKFDNSTILIKGSRGMALERFLEYLK